LPAHRSPVRLNTNFKRNVTAAIFRNNNGDIHVVVRLKVLNLTRNVKQDTSEIELSSHRAQDRKILI